MNDKTERRPDIGEAQRHATLVWLVGVVATILVVMFLRQTAWITGPAALAFFAALALWPVDGWIRDHTPGPLQWLGHAAALVIMVLVFALFSSGLVFAARQVAAGLSRYEDKLRDYAQRLGELGAFGGEGGDGSGLVERLIDPVMSLATTILQSIWSSGGILTLVFFLIWLMLVDAPRFGAKLPSLVSREHDVTLHGAITAIASRFRRYLIVRTAMGVITGTLYMVWIWWWGLDFVLVWGLLAFLLNYIPTVGSLIAGSLPAALAFLQRDPATAVLIAGGLLVIEQFMGNYVDPRLQGRQLSLSPLVVLLALMFWTWIWGLIGALLAVPMTLVITIACARVEALHPIALFISDARNREELMESTS